MSLLASWLASPPPDAAIEIAPEAVSIAVLGGRGRKRRRQGLRRRAAAERRAWCRRSRRPISPTATRGRGALRRVLDSVGVRPRRVALVVPDLVGQGLAGSIRSDAGRARGSRSVDSLADEEVHAVSDRGRRVTYAPGARRPTAATSSSWRWRAATSFADTRASAKKRD